MTDTDINLAAAAAPRSDQINADDLFAGPQIVTITEVRRGNSEQPVEIVTAEYGPGRPYKPGKSMIRVLLAAWGDKAQTYIGRRLMIYRDPEITFGRDKVGGIRISALSHIDKRMSISLTVTRGRRAPFIVEPLPDATPDPQQLTDTEIDDIMTAIDHAITTAEIDGIARENAPHIPANRLKEVKQRAGARRAELEQEAKE